MAIFDPFHPLVGTNVDIPFFFYLVEHPAGNLLFDTGGHPDLITNPRSRLGDALDVFEICMDEGDDAASRVATMGLTPGDIEHVALSHLHYDHAGGVQSSQASTFYVQRRELEFAHWPPIYQRSSYVRADFDLPVHWVELDGERDVFGDGRVVLFPTPGHTPGHQSLLVRLEHMALILAATPPTYYGTSSSACFPRYSGVPMRWCRAGT